MIEIAICLAIIGFALVAIIGVLPLGMHTQRDTREETVINQDATVLLEVVRGAARGADNLTNNVYAIANNWGYYNASGVMTASGSNGFTYTGSTIPNNWPLNQSPLLLTNGVHIVGLMSVPEFMDGNGRPIVNLFNGGYSNHVTAYVRSISGLAAEKPPQNNQIMQEDTFTYHVYCVNAPLATDTNVFNLPLAQRLYATQLAASQHELRLTFLWPQLPNGSLPANPNRQTFRATVAGQLAQDSTNNSLYFYQSQSFTNAP